MTDECHRLIAFHRNLGLANMRDVPSPSIVECSNFYQRTVIKPVSFLFQWVYVWPSLDFFNFFFEFSNDAAPFH